MAQPPTPLHAYELNGSLADTYGGPAITNNGGSLGAAGITFLANNGPSLENWIAGTATSGNYSIEMYFSITTTSSYRKLIDFSNRSSDNGLYNLSTSLSFYPMTTGSNGAITDNVMTHLVLTRDGTTGDVFGYINGSITLGISFTDSSNFATFTGTNNIMHFFRDDSVTSFNEASDGFVDFIRIYDRPLSASEAALLFAAIPEPTSIALACFGMAGVVALKPWKRFARRHRRAKSA